MHKKQRRFADNLAVFLTAAIAVCAISQSASAQSTRQIPPPGMALGDTDLVNLTTKLHKLDEAVDQLRMIPAAQDLLPDVIIFQKAVGWSVEGSTIYNAKEIAAADELLDEGLKRAAELKAGKPLWTSQTGLVVRGYRSKIDDSVQPYGLVVPADWTPADTKKRRLDLFLHGRGEQLTELAFLNEHRHNAGEFTPPGAFVLHPYGRFCNANHFAGERDVWEAMQNVDKHYPIDRDRVVLRGFSMGGASAWHLATHFSYIWAAAAPGAGFSETADFTGIVRNPNNTVPDWVKTLWHLYDATDYAVNLTQCPTVAYNGDKDGQKQAADRMEDALKAENRTLNRIIGKDAGHWYTSDGKTAINKFVDEAIAPGKEHLPKTVLFTTWTLKYNRMDWLAVEGLEHHWQRARVEARRENGDRIIATTSNVDALSFDLPDVITNVRIDGQRLPVTSTHNAPIRFAKSPSGKWMQQQKASAGLQKKPGLQGPIDDAFMDRFVFVRPTGKPLTPKLGEWVTAAHDRAVQNWHRYLRGNALEADDRDLTDAQIASSNLVLWGDPSSNTILARLLPKLPIRWNRYGLVANGKRYSVGSAIPVLIYPNPLNPERYIVINSGFTWWRYASDNNALMTPWLPDWAILDTNETTDKTLAAGFFNEKWQF